MKILGIETSCDETAAAVVENGIKVLSNVIASQVPLHRKTGGVVPEVAAREHVIKIIPVIKKALKVAKIKLRDIDAIAVTSGPGLLSSLIIGTSTAQTLALATDKPLIPVNHIAGHIYANWLEKAPARQRVIQFPCVVLTASGGHSELILMKKHVHFQLLGETLDDAAGEAFDKVARLLGLAYPGGPEIARLALRGDPAGIALPKAYLHEQSYDFSFSGLKTAVLNLIKEEYRHSGQLSQKFTCDAAAAFQEVACEVLSDKLLRATQQYGAKSALLAGGVSANQRLRAMLEKKIKLSYYSNVKGQKANVKYYKAAMTSKPALFYPLDYSFCTDNAAMIAGAAYFLCARKPKNFLKSVKVVADPQLEFSVC